MSSSSDQPYRNASRRGRRGCFGRFLLLLAVLFGLVAAVFAFAVWIDVKIDERRARLDAEERHRQAVSEWVDQEAGSAIADAYEEMERQRREAESRRAARLRDENRRQAGRAAERNDRIRRDREAEGALSRLAEKETRWSGLRDFVLEERASTWKKYQQARADRKNLDKRVAAVLETFGGDTAAADANPEMLKLLRRRNALADRIRKAERELRTAYQAHLSHEASPGDGTFAETVANALDRADELLGESTWKKKAAP